VEQTPPPGYVDNASPQCSGLLTGTTAVPPPPTTITTADKEATVGLSVHKYNAADPNIGIPGAVYDVYVQGTGPPSGAPTAPTGTPAIPGDKWWAQGTTTTAGMLQFTVPAGYSWCVKEITAPVDYLLDTGIHCTNILWTTTPSRELTVAVPETLANVTVYAHKYDAETPRTTVPGATYELVGQGTPPAGWSASTNPGNYPVPTGDWYVGAAVTGATGIASWTTASTPGDETVALPEVPVTIPALAYTGGPPIWLGGAGLGLAGGGGVTTLFTRRRRREAP
jgi:hypothetical protein